MNCPYKEYFASLVRQAKLKERINSSFDEDITMTTTKNNMMAQEDCQKNHKNICNRSVANKTDKVKVGGEKISGLTMVVVADPAASSPSLNRLRFQQQQEKAATSHIPLHLRWGVVDSPSRKCSHTTHHQNRPPSPPIRKPSYDTWSNFEQSKTGYDDDESRTCDAMVEEEYPIIETTKKEEDFAKNDPVVQNKIDPFYLSVGERHCSSADEPPPGTVVWTRACILPQCVQSKKNDRGGRLCQQENVRVVVAAAAAGVFNNASRWAPSTNSAPVMGLLPMGERRPSCC
jgi:hypothetical protein